MGTNESFCRLNANRKGGVRQKQSEDNECGNGAAYGYGVSACPKTPCELLRNVSSIYRQTCQNERRVLWRKYQQFVVPCIDRHMADLQPPRTEEQQVTFAQLVQPDLLAFFGLIVRDTGEVDRERMPEHFPDKRGTIKGRCLSGCSAEFIRGAKVFLPVGDQFISLPFC